MAYSVKPATTIVQQVALLKGRGLVIPDEAAATAILQRISYYRLSGYLVELRRHVSDLGGCRNDVLRVGIQNV